MRSLHRLLEDSARRCPDQVAVEDPDRGERITYRELNRLSGELRDDLIRQGVRSTDRVALCARKSIAGVISIFGVLKAGAAYVPVAADAPGDRNAKITSDCAVKALLADEFALQRFRDGRRGHDIGAAQDCAALSSYGDRMALVSIHGDGPPPGPRPGVPDDLAYILYTSGSTGMPKGVMHSHASASSFVDWCSGTFEPTQSDRMSSHAPFHFDLSVFDIYVAIKHGATLVLIGEETGKQAAHLAARIAGQRISIWYSTPSVLRHLVEYGRLEQHDYSHLRLVLFAGEVFPPRHLALLLERWPERRYFNLYGPTETNVCTFSEIEPGASRKQSGLTSIGKACSGTMTRVMNAEGAEVRQGEEGELCVSGGTVMHGYWGQPALDAGVFRVDDEGRRWYRTGDLVKESAAGDYLFLGRRDRMVKRRGYRIELGEIESLIYRHPLVADAAVVAFVDQEEDVLIKAFLCWAEEKTPSLVALKRFCSENMPSYCIPDQFCFMKSIPRTSTDKIDYQSLQGTQ